MRRSKSRAVKKRQPPRKTRLSGIRVVTATEFRRRFEDLLVELDRERIIPITRHGRPEFVWMQVDDYERLLTGKVSTRFRARLEKVSRFISAWKAPKAPD